MRRLLLLGVLTLLGVLSIQGQDASAELKVASFFPGESDVPTNSQIIVIFNRPVVPLSLSVDQASLPTPLRIEPAVAGTGEWVNTSIYQFTPAEGLAGGQRYSVTIPQGSVTSVDGIPLSADFAAQFTVTPPSIITLMPGADETLVSTEAFVRLVFSEPVDRASAAAAFRLRTLAGDEVAVTLREGSDDRTLDFVPDEPLTLDTRYVITFEGDAAAAGGGVVDASLLPAQFTTVPLPAVVSSTPFDGQDMVRLDPFGNSISVEFVSDMDADSLRENTTITPEPENGEAWYWFFSSWNRSYTMAGLDLAPRTTYTVTVGADATDTSGNPLGEAFTFSFTTGDASAVLALRTPGVVGLYNAALPGQGFFVAYRNVSSFDAELYAYSVDAYVASFMDGYFRGVLNERSLPEAAPVATLRFQGEAEPNQYRFQYIDLASFSGGNCAGAPVTRLRVGDRARVVLEDEPVRARSAPDGEIVDLLYRDYALRVIGGPVCSSGFLFWQVTLRDGQAAWVAEGDVAEYFIAPLDAPDTNAAPELATSTDGAQPPGLYLVNLRTESPGVMPSQGHLMILSTASLTVKTADGQVLVWAIDLQTGGPIANAEITLHARIGPDSAYRIDTQTARTDENGIVLFDVERDYHTSLATIAVLDDGTHFAVADSTMNDGIEPWMFGLWQAYWQPAYTKYLYTDRPLYRPGQQVNFKGVVREMLDLSYSLPDVDSVTAFISDFNGTELYRETLPLNDFGTFNGTFTLPGDVQLGEHYLRFEIETPAAETESHSVSFIVAEFRTPEFTMSAQPAAREVVQGDEVSVTFGAEYFFGGPVSSADASYFVTNDAYFFDYTGEGRYTFSNADRYTFSAYGQTVGSGQLTTDAEGQVTVSVPAALADITRSETWIVEATVTDETGFSVSTRTPVVVHAAQLYAGIASSTYVAEVDEEVTFDLIAVDWDSQPQPGQTLTFEVRELSWSSVQEEDPFGNTVFNSVVSELAFDTRTLVSRPDGTAQAAFLPGRAGSYRVYVSTQDDAGRTAVASMYLWVAGDGAVSWRETNSKSVDLIADADEYAIGDTAEILIPSPFNGPVQALITVERGLTLFHDIVEISGSSALYELPIVESYAPNVFVSVMLVKAATVDDPIADFRVGYETLNVDRSRRVLTLTVERTVDDRAVDFALPQQAVTYTITATDYLGNPVESEISVQMVDEAVLSVVADQTTPILDAFFGPQRLSVTTGTLLTLNGDAARQEILDVFKGGGGGGGPMGVPDVRDELLDAPYWNATLRTDAQGVVSFVVQLPDNLTVWRLTARGLNRAADGNLLVGEAVDTLRTTKPLIIRPVTPRFFVMDDAVTLSAVVNNNTDENLTVDVRINATGVRFVDLAAETQTVDVAANSRAEVSWDVIVTDAAAVTATFSAETAAYADATISPVSIDRDGTLPVYRYEVTEFVGTAGVAATPGVTTESIMLPEDVTRDSLDLSVEASLAALALRAARTIERDDSDCLECIVSRLIINVSAYDALTLANALDPAAEQRILEQTSSAVAALTTRQNTDGSWAWAGTSSSDRPTTIYVLLGLTLLTEQEIVPVNQQLIQRAVGYLEGTANPTSEETEVWQLNREAFEVFVLARAGADPMGRLNNLYDQQARLALYGRALLLQAMIALDPDDPRVQGLVDTLASAVSLSASGARWQEARRDRFTWNTDTRTSAMVLRALILAEADPALLANGVRGLVTLRRADTWATLQESAWALWALTDFARTTGELMPDYTYSAALNDERLLEGSAAADTVTESRTARVPVEQLESGANTLTIERSEGPGVLYYAVDLEADLPITAYEEYASGFYVSRRYLRPGTDEPVTSAQVGEVVEVRVTVVAPDDQYFVIVEDPLPAGMEAIDPGLLTAQQAGTQPALDPQDPMAQGWGWWLFDSIQYRTQKVVMSADYLPAGTYEFVYTMRAVIPGVYNVIPATAREQYFPDIYGRSAGVQFTVRQ